MPDITMCANSACPIADFCYRAMAKPAKFMQSYAFFEPKEFPIGTWTCAHFIPLKSQEKTDV